MADCVDFFQRSEAVKNPNGFDNESIFDYSHDGTQDMKTALSVERGTEAADREFRAAASEALNEAMGPEDPTEPMQPLERGDQTRVNDIRQSLFRSDVENAFDVARYKQLQDILQRVNGRTVNDNNLWLHLTSRISKVFTNKRSPFAEYLHLYHDDGSNSLLNNELFSEMSHLEARTNGEMERLSKGHVERLDSLANDIAKELGLPSRVNEIRQIIGDYAIFRHIIEDGANYALLDRFQREIDRIDSMPPENAAQYSNKRAQYEYNMDMLAKHIDSDKPPSHLVSVGFTDGEARLLMDEIRKLGIDEAKLIEGADELVRWNSELLEADAKAGKISPQQYDHLMQNGFQYYVPVMHRSNNATGYINDTHPYYEANYQVRSGSDDIPDDAYTSTLMRTRRVAGHIATRPISDELLVMAQENMKRVEQGGEDNGLRIYDTSVLERATNSRDMGNEMRADWAARAKSSGGFVTEEPVIENGHIVDTKRVLVYFDPNWKGRNGLSGAELNEALLFNQSTNPGGVVGKTMTTLNSAYGQAFTRFRPWFGMVNSGRDSFERFTHIASRDYIDANGNILPGWKLLAKYSKNVLSAYTNLPHMLVSMKRGTFDMNSPEGKLWQDFVRYGVHQDYTWGREGSRFAQESIQQVRGSRGKEGLPKYLQDRSAEGLRSVINQLGERPGRAMIDALDGFNDYWNNVAAFAHFKTLREAGVPAERAARNVLDSMDFQQQGTRTALLRCFFPFVKPIAQSAAAMSRVLGLTYDKRGFVQNGWKGWSLLAGMGFAMEGLMTYAQESMGKDEDGNWRIDQLPLSKLSRGVPIGLGGENGAYAFINTGYGAPRLLNTILWGADRMKRGMLDSSSYAGNILLTFVQEMSPGNWPEFSFKDNPAEYIVQSIAPAFLSPVFEVATGKNSFGNDIKRFKAPPEVAKADYGGGSSMKAYNKMAQILRRYTGYDMYPEEVQHFVEGYAVGPAILIRALCETVFGENGASIRDTEHYKQTHLHPVLEALGATMSFGYADDVARSLFQQAENRLIKVIKDNRIKQTSSTAYKGKEQQEQWWRAQCEDAGIDDATADDIVLYFKAANQLHSGSREINEYLRNEINSGIDYFDLLEKYEERTAGRRQIYRDFVNSANMFRR